MIRKIILLTAFVAVPFIGSTKTAQAEEYCREYTKTVSVGGRAEQAYGTACYRPDGSWEIVDLQGSDYARAKVRDVMYDDIERSVNYNDRNRVVVVEHYNSTPRYYRPYARYKSVHYTASPFVFLFGNTYHKNNHKSYNRAKYNNKQYKKQYKNARYNYRNDNRYRNNNVRQSTKKQEVQWQLRGDRLKNKR